LYQTIRLESILLNYREEDLLEETSGHGIVQKSEVAMKETHEQQCGNCGATLVLRPVPGAKNFPRRLECLTYGWEKERVRTIRMRFHKDRPDW
jgi:hypothetical protein